MILQSCLGKCYFISLFSFRMGYSRKKRTGGAGYGERGCRKGIEEMASGISMGGLAS